MLKFIKHSDICSSVEKNGLRLYNPHSDNNATGGMLQVCTAAGIWTAVCDYLFKCTAEGKAACKQLGYGGANMSENPCSFFSIFNAVTWTQESPCLKTVLCNMDHGITLLVISTTYVLLLPCLLQAVASEGQVIISVTLMIMLAYGV